MRQISSLLQGLARSLSVGRDRRGDGAGAGDGKAAAPAVLRTSGTVWGEGSETFAAVCSRRGEKGTNQDCSIVWEVSYYSALSLSLTLSENISVTPALLVCSLLHALLNFSLFCFFFVKIIGDIKLRLRVIAQNA